MKKFTLVASVAVMLITGCAQSTEPAHEHEHNAHEEPMQPTLEYTIGSDDWSVVTTMNESPEVLEAYQFAVSHPEVLDYMPCYCGCYEEDGHTSNTNCFVEKVENGIVTLDTMGFG